MIVVKIVGRLVPISEPIAAALNPDKAVCRQFMRVRLDTADARGKNASDNIKGFGHFS